MRYNSEVLLPPEITNSQIDSTREQPKEVISSLEFCELRNLILEQTDPIRPDLPKEPKERAAAVDRLIHDFIDKLLAQRERFARIFKTENNSIYFQLASGESLRIRKSPNGYDYTDIKPITEKTYYITGEEGARLDTFTENMRRRVALINQPIYTTKPQAGVYPLEFGQIFNGVAEMRTAIEEHPDYIIPKGFLEPGRRGAPDRIDPNDIGVNHLGNKITEIIK